MSLAITRAVVSWLARLYTLKKGRIIARTRCMGSRAVWCWFVHPRVTKERWSMRVWVRLWWMWRPGSSEKQLPRIS